MPDELFTVDEAEEYAASPEAPEAPVGVDTAESVQADAEVAPVTHRVVVDPDAPVLDDLRIAFPGSHQVAGADPDGFLSLPVDLTAEQANNAQNNAFASVEEIG